LLYQRGPKKASGFLLYDNLAQDELFLKALFLDARAMDKGLHYAVKSKSGDAGRSSLQSILSYSLAKP